MGSLMPTVQPNLLCSDCTQQAGESQDRKPSTEQGTKQGLQKQTGVHTGVNEWQGWHFQSRGKDSYSINAVGDHKRNRNSFHLKEIENERNESPSHRKINTKC